MAAARDTLDYVQPYLVVFVTALVTAMAPYLMTLHSRVTVEERTSVHHEDISQLRTDVALLTQTINRLAAQRSTDP